MKSFRMYLIERLYRSELKHRIAHLDDEQTKEAVRELCAADLKRKIAHLSFERNRDKIDDDLPEIIEKDITRIGFASLIDLADKTTTNCPLEEQISFYDYLINIVLADACAQQSLRPLISGGYGKPILNGFLDKYYDEKEGCGISAFVDEKYKLKAVYLFGSYARGTATDESDVDILVDREGSLVHSLLQMGGLYCDLENAVQKEIDLVTTQTLEQESTKKRSPYFINEVNREKVIVFEKK